VAPLGYAWWYLDAVSDDGRFALVLTAFIGSVFSPFYYRARQHGARDPYEYSAINVALYGTGRGKWAFTEYQSEAVRCRANSLQIGRNRLTWSDATLTCDVDELTAPLPSKIRGVIRLQGAALDALRLPLTADGSHRWQPIVPRARVTVELEHPAVRWHGSGYLDANEGDAPLEEAFRSWTWLRAHTRAGATVIYTVRPVHGPSLVHALSFSASGAVQPFTPPQPAKLPSTAWRLGREIAADRDGRSRLLTTLEDAPFYARSLVETQLCGERVTAVHESLSLERFQSGWVRLLLPFRMRRSRR
jgi:carotenoid 1,2-hydratase